MGATLTVEIDEGPRFRSEESHRNRTQEDSTPKARHGRLALGRDITLHGEGPRVRAQAHSAGLQYEQGARDPSPRKTANGAFKALLLSFGLADL